MLDFAAARETSPRIEPRKSRARELEERAGLLGGVC